MSAALTFRVPSMFAGTTSRAEVSAPAWTEAASTASLSVSGATKVPAESFSANAAPEKAAAASWLMSRVSPESVKSSFRGCEWVLDVRALVMLLIDPLMVRPLLPDRRRVSEMVTDDFY